MVDCMDAGGRATQEQLPKRPGDNRSPAIPTSVVYHAIALWHGAGTAGNADPDNYGIEALRVRSDHIGNPGHLVPGYDN